MRNFAYLFTTSCCPFVPFFLSKIKDPLLNQITPAWYRRKQSTSTAQTETFQVSGRKVECHWRPLLLFVIVILYGFSVADAKKSLQQSCPPVPVSAVISALDILDLDPRFAVPSKSDRSILAAVDLGLTLAAFCLSAFAAAVYLHRDQNSRLFRKSWGYKTMNQLSKMKARYCGSRLLLA